MSERRSKKKPAPASGQPSYGYGPLLRQWSRELLTSKLAAQVGATPGESADWLGTRPASPESLATTEARLGVALPPSYRQFLFTTDGWGALSPFVHRLRPASEIEWFASENANSVEVWSHSDDGGLSDAEYFTYGDGEGENPWFRGEHLRHALQISERGDGELLLNPRAVTPDGEWECWFLAAWIPGVRRYASFAHWLVQEYRSFRRLEGVDGPEPALPTVTVPAPSVNRKAIKPKRPKVPPRPIEALMHDMADDDPKVRSKATRELVGRLKLRFRAERQPELIEPLTQLFRGSADPAVRSLCIQMLTQVAGDDEPGFPEGDRELNVAPPAILEAFADPDPWVVVAGIWAHSYFDVTPAFDALCRFVETTDNALIKDSAVAALGEIGDPRAVPVLVRVLHDRRQTFDQLFGTAGLALARCGGSGVPHLVAALDDVDPRVRLAAVVGVAQLPGEATTQHLRAALDDPAESVRERAAMFLRSGSASDERE